MAPTDRVSTKRTPRQEIEAEIRAYGKITFARFMHLALYSAGGYYRTVAVKRRDYATSPQVHPAFGALIARCLFDMWRKLGEPTRFRVIELGAGDGCLAQDIAEAAASASSLSMACESFARAIRYEAFDAAPRSVVSNAAASVRSNVMLDEDSVRADCVLSNELLDAFPVHKFEVWSGKVRELFVTLDSGGDFMYAADHPSTPELQSRLEGIVQRLPEGYRGEVNLGIADWAKTLSRILRRGYVLTIDYGAYRHVLYHPMRNDGSLRCYRNHVLGQNPFRAIGDQDITAHVDFTELDAQLSASGFERADDTQTQRDFLYRLGIGDYLMTARTQRIKARRENDFRFSQATLRSLNALVDPRGLGSFIVAQHRIDAPALDSDPENLAAAFPMPQPKDRHLRY